MLSRAIWTGLLALLAWLPIGHAESRAVRSERLLYAQSALDIATDTPARVAHRADLPQEITIDRRPAPPRVVPPHGTETALEHPSPRTTWRPADTLTPSGWRGFVDARLILPHDATAPPPPPLSRS